MEPIVRRLLKLSQFTTHLYLSSVEGYDIVVEMHNGDQVGAKALELNDYFAVPLAARGRVFGLWLFARTSSLRRTYEVLRATYTGIWSLLCCKPNLVPTLAGE